MTNSNRKGKDGEREFAGFVRDQGFEARRGQQFHGGGDSPDVVTELGRVHFEVKRVEQFRLYEALDQAAEDSIPGQLPVVAHRRSRKPWVIVMDAADFFNIVRMAREEPEKLKHVFSD